MEFIHNIDNAIMNFVQTNMHTAIGDVIFPIITYLGEAGVVWLLIGVIMLFFKKTRICGISMLISILTVYILGEVLVKNLVGRIRPCNNTELELAINMLVRSPESFSFPSGHSSSSFAAATSIFIRNKKWGIPAMILAALIAFSRVYVFVHYPTDVLVGTIFGIITAVVINYFINKFIENRKLKFSGDRKS